MEFRTDFRRKRRQQSVLPTVGIVVLMLTFVTPNHTPTSYKLKLMEKQISKYIAVSYKLYSIMDGTEELEEEATVGRPFRFISGLGMTLDKFESTLQDLEVGQRFNFVIPMSEAYGEYDEDKVLNLPREIFCIDGKFDHQRVREGEVIPLLTTEGQRVNGLVLEIDDDKVVTDINHPLAGCDLRFVGEVLMSRPATSMEITDAVRMMSGGCGGCGGGGCDKDGCGGGDCGNGCGGCK